MTKLYITEYDKLAHDANGNVVLAGHETAVAGQQVAIGAGTVASAAFGKTTKLVLLHPDVTCHVRFGTAPTAVQGEYTRLTAGSFLYFGVQGLVALKVAVIEA